MDEPIRAVGVIFENNEGEILALKRHKSRPEGGTWGLVGGKLDGQEDWPEAAKREVNEEIGFTLDEKELEYLNDFHLGIDGKAFEFKVYKIKVKLTELKISLNPIEHVDYIWIIPSELFKYENLMSGLYPILQDIYGLA